MADGPGAGGVDIGHDRKLVTTFIVYLVVVDPIGNALISGCRWYPGRRPKNAHRTGRHAGRDRDNAVL